MKKHLKKRNHQAGFTLTELLATVLILSFVSIVLAGGISAAMRVQQETVAKTDAQNVASIVAQVVMDELRYALDISEADGAVRFTSMQYGADVTLTANEKGYLEIGGYQLLRDAAYAGMTVEPTLEWDGSVFQVTLEMKQNDKVWHTVAFRIKPLEK